MRSRNKIQIAVVLMVLCLSTLTLIHYIKYYASYTKASSSCYIWDKFSGNIKRGNYTAAKEMLLQQPIDNYPLIQTYLRFDNNRIFYYEHDITNFLATSKSRYLPTLDYYLKSKGDYVYDKVIFHSGYALIFNEQIFYIKMP